MLEHTLVGEVPVEVAPGELLLDVASGLEGGQCLDHLGNGRLLNNLCPFTCFSKINKRKSRRE